MVSNFKISLTPLISLIGLMANFSVEAQRLQITGSVRNSAGQFVDSAVVILKDSLTLTPLTFTFTVDGKFAVFLERSAAVTNHVAVAVTAYGYSPFHEFVKFKDSSLHIDLTLFKDTTYVLEEVTVSANTVGQKTIGDTTKFSIAHYQRPEDRKLEDVIRRLPGMEVNPVSGEIKYQGRIIQTILLDGDNLLDNNYKVASKNIDIDVIEEVQAIKNFHENEVLGDLMTGDQVALNVKLRKGAIDITGSAEIGFGAGMEKIPIDVNGNLLSVNSSSKSLVVASLNNIGVSRAPFDYLNFSPLSDESQLQTLSPAIPNQTFSSAFETQRTNINNQLFGNVNTLYRFNKRYSFKVNGYLTQDQLENKTIIKSTNHLQDKVVDTSDETTYIRSPLLRRFDAVLKMKLSTRSLTELGLLSWANIAYNTTDQITNEIFFLSTSLASREDVVQYKLVHSTRLDSARGFQLTAFHVNNSIAQQFTSAGDNFAMLQSFSQQVSPTRRMTGVDAVFVKSKRQGRLALAFGFHHQSTELESERKDAANNVEGSSDTQYGSRNVYLKYTWKLRRREWTYSGSATMHYLNQELPGYYNDSHNVFLNADVLVSRRVGKGGFLSFSGSHDNRSLSDAHLISETIFIGTRQRIRDSLNLSLQRRSNGQIQYSYNNSANDISIHAGIGIQRDEGNFLTRYYIDELSITELRNWSEDALNEVSFGYLKAEKFFPDLNCNIKSSSTISEITYFNFLGNSNVRVNTFSMLSHSIFVKTAFDKSLNFETTAKMDVSSANGNGNKFFGNIRVQNTFKLVYVPRRKFFVMAAITNLWPSTINSRADFLDITVRYRPKGKRYSFAFFGRNLLDQNQITEFRVSDFFESAQSANVIDPFVMAQFNIQI